MFLKIKVDDNLGRAIGMLQAAESGTQDAMRESADKAITGTWQQAVMANASTAAERKLIATGATADVFATGPGFVLDAGIGPSLSGGYGQGPEDWAGIEYGMTPVQILAPHRRKTLHIAGTGREVTSATMIWIGKNLRPRNSQGYVAMPAVRKHGPEFVAAWIYGLVGQLDDSQGALEVRR